MIILGLFYYFLFCAAIAAVVFLIGDILMMRRTTGISWKESVRCGWLYFIDRFKKI